MRCLLVSDIHQQTHNLAGLIDRAGKPIDLVICAGDLTNWGNRADATAIVNLLRPSPCLTIPGNLDTPEVEAYLVDTGSSIHAQCRIFQGWTFVGFGGGSAGFVGESAAK
ncbi:MAG: metallophosphoesterase family protein [Deltaproteobacteria bacterium]|nr:metallophosphoesterase family protein [Deltaproteobacteria bacterium]